MIWRMLGKEEDGKIKWAQWKAQGSLIVIMRRRV